MKRLIVAIALAAFTAGLSAQPTSPGWREFRRQHPYHVQGLALSEPDPSGRRTLVVAEPPPSVTPASMARVDPLLGTPSVMTTAVGTDGWVKDLVFELPAMTAPRLAALVDRLSLEMFGTTYKAYALPITAAPSPPRAALDLQVSAPQLQAWLTDGSERFHPLGVGAASTISELLATSRAGVFYSTKPGLVAWIVSRRADVSALRRETRQFALDTDLILGAIPGATHVAIIARERQTPVELLPPLRSETIALLASVGDDELGQSYERRAFGAGKLELTADWAPIYLSDVLIDTEYGSLLNITDQLLKSWTEAGTTSYARFDYPNPPRWPFERPLTAVLQTESLTFNWNTTGAGYALATPAGEVFALNRTGALPVSYMPQGLPDAQAAQVARYEDTAYNFFATTGDPNLARVVQYAGLYQIFRHYLTDAPHHAAKPIQHPEMTALAAVVQRNLQLFADATDDDLVELAFDNGYELPMDALEAVHEAQAALREYRAGMPDLTFATLARSLTNPRPDLQLLQSSSSAGEAAALRLLSASVLRPLLDPFMYALFPVDEAFDAYRTAAVRETTSWIKTPSYVLSLSSDPDEVTGGHSLSARVTRFETSASVPAGKATVRVNARGERVVVVNPIDASKVAAAVRTAAREEPAQLQASIERVLRTTARTTPTATTRSVALGLSSKSEVAPAGADRGLLAAHVPGAAYRSGWRVAAPAAAEYKTPIARTTSVFVERDADFSYRVTVAGMDETYAATSHDAAIDLVAASLQGRPGAPGGATIVFSGVDRTEAGNFLRSVEVRTKAHGTATGIGRSSTTRVAELRATLERTYDFRAAKVVDSTIEAVPGVGERLHLTLEIPPIEVAARQPLRVRITALFRQRITDPLKQSIERVLSRLFPSGAGVATAARPTGLDILAAIKADLRRIHPDAVVDVDVAADAADFYVAELEVDHADARA